MTTTLGAPRYANLHFGKSDSQNELNDDRSDYRRFALVTERRQGRPDVGAPRDSLALVA